MTISPMKWLGDLETLQTITTCRLNGVEASLADAFAAVSALFRETREAQGTVWWVGNGGSNAICSHLAQDVLNKLRMRSQAMSDPSLMTCMANDFGYAEVYARPLRQLARTGDMLIAISSSGNSPNIIACADMAKSLGMKLVTLSAFKNDNKLWNHPSDVAFFLPVDLYGLAEVGHEALLYAVIECQWLEEKTAR